MSVARMPTVSVKYRWCFGQMIPWYRQILALVFGGGVMLIALWAIQQGSGAWMIGTVAGMAFLTLLLIFGVELDTLEVTTGGFSIDFSNTTMERTRTVREENDDE